IQYTFSSILRCPPSTLFPYTTLLPILYLTLSGNAQQTTDYTFSSVSFNGSNEATVTIAANATNAVFSLTPVHDTIDEPNETAQGSQEHKSSLRVRRTLSRSLTLKDEDN